MRDTRFIIGPLGQELTIETLPPAQPTRWVARRKAEIVAAVTGGLMSLEDALATYALTLEEFTHWRNAFERGGLRALIRKSGERHSSLSRKARQICPAVAL